MGDGKSGRNATRPTTEKRVKLFFAKVVSSRVVWWRLKAGPVCSVFVPCGERGWGMKIVW